jgi:hypothetical protein
VHSVGDLVEGLCEIANGEGFAETCMPFVSLPIAFTSGVLVVNGFIGGCIGRQLASSHEDLAIRGTETGVSSLHLV